AGIKATTRYDALGRKIFESLPFTTAEKGATIAYDGIGRIMRRTNSDATHVDFVYGADTDSIIDENGNTTQHTRQAFGDRDAGRLVSVTDAAQQTWTYEYNARGRLTKVIAPDGIQRRWNYDLTFDRLTSEVQPESGTTTYTNYDAAGNLKGTVDAK